MKNIQGKFSYIIGSFLGLYFIYKGFTKHFLNTCKVYTSESTEPLVYQELMTILCQSGLTTIVGGIQILSGILLLIPKLRLVGAIMLLPIISNIFLFHVFLDNRPHENIETGLLLLLNILIIALDFNKWKVVFKQY